MKNSKCNFPIKVDAPEQHSIGHDIGLRNSKENSENFQESKIATHMY